MSTRKNILKLFSAVGAFLICYPISAFFCGVIGGSVFDQLLSFAILFAAFLLVFFLTWIINAKTKLPGAVCTIVGILITLLCVLLVFYIPITNLIFKILICSESMAAGILGVLFSHREYTELLSKKRYKAELIVYALMFLPNWVFGHWFAISYSYVVSLIFLLVATAIRFVVINQFTIEKSTVSRKYSLKSLPPQIYRFNLKLVAILFSCILLLVPVAAFAGNAIDSQLSKVMNTVEDYEFSTPPTLFDDFNGESQQIKEPDGEQQEMLPANDQSDFSWVVYLVCGVFFAAIVAALIFYNIGFFPRKLRDFIKRITSLFRRKKKLSAESGEYTDSIQELSTSDNSVYSDGLSKKKRNYKAQYKQYKKMQNSYEKYRFGYKLARQGLALCTNKLKASDTPNETIPASFGIAEDSYTHSTAYYNLLYYGEQEYSHQNEQIIDECLVKISDSVAKLRQQ